MATGGGEDETIQVWRTDGDAAAWYDILLRGHGGAIRALTFDPSGTRILSADESHVIVWNLQDHDPSAAPDVLVEGKSDRIDFSSNRHWVLNAARGVVRLWSLADGDRRPSARVIADCDLPALRELLGPAPLRVYTRTTVRSVTRLALVCAQVRVDGFALDEGEYLDEVRCVAAPIRDPQGETVASVGISSPLTRLHRRGVARAAAEVRKTARAITVSLAS
jgi:WD40 repeat protein